MTKRLLLAVCIAAALAAGTAFAQVSVSGQIEYGTLTNFEDAPGQHWDNQLIFNAKIDQFNSGLVRFRARQSVDSAAYANPGLEVSDAPLIDRFYVTTDVLGALAVKGAPVKWVMTNGFAYVSTADLSDMVSPFEVADLDNDNFVALGGGTQGVHYSVLTFQDMWNVRLAIAPASFGDDIGGWFVSVDGELCPLSCMIQPEVVYSVNGSTPMDEGNLILALKYSKEMDDFNFAVSPQFLYSLASDANEEYAYAISASLGYADLLTVSAGFLGLDGSSANRMEAQLILTPNKVIGFDFGAVLNLDDDYYATGAGDTNIVNDIDINAFVTLGATVFRIGYLHLGEEGFDSWINDDMSRTGRGDSHLKQGGMYFEATVSF